jgi:hypothetical protein
VLLQWIDQQETSKPAVIVWSETQPVERNGAKQRLRCLNCVRNRLPKVPLFRTAVSKKEYPGPFREKLRINVFADPLQKNTHSSLPCRQGEPIQTKGFQVTKLQCVTVSQSVPSMPHRLS